MAGAVGAQLFQPPITLINTMNFATQKAFQPVVADSIFQPSPTWWRMTRTGKKITGGSLVWGVITTEETTGGAYWGVQNLDTSAVDSAVPAELQWKGYYENITIPWDDLVLNTGETQVVDLVKVKSEIAMGSLLQKLSRAVWGTSPQNTSIDLDSLPAAMAASGTYANITISTTTGWACNGGATHGGFTGPTTTAGALTLATMQSEYGLATFGNEEPDTCITTQTQWNAYWNLLTTNQRFINQDDETTRAGFKNHLMFNNAVVLHDGFCPSGEMYFMTSKYSQPVFHANDYFKVWPFIMPTNQLALVAKITVKLNWQLYALRNHSRHTALT